MSPDEARRVTTRHLDVAPEAVAVAAPPRQETSLLDTLLPWVVEFRIVGTATTVQAQVREAMVIGRSDMNSGFRPEIDLMPFDAFNKGVSRRHALITVKNNRLFLRDLNSTNGTFINGAPCLSGQETRLRHGDELQLGHLRMQMTFAVVPTVGVDQTTEMAKLPPEPDAVRGAGQRVLIVESDPEVGAVFKAALAEAGYTPILTQDVTRGLGVLFQAMPDAIILDMMLPEMNGLDLLHYVRRQKAGHVPVLVIDHGSAGGYQQSQAIGAGADVILSKPVPVATLLGALAGVFTSAE